VQIGVMLTVFGLIVPAELPDKTMVATLVLSTRFPPLPVWVGVVSAFAVQCGTAVIAGGVVALLPRRPVLAVSAALFLLGAVLLLRAKEVAEEEAAEVEAELRREPPSRSFRRAALTSFGVLFAAEWGDLSQILTASLAARYDAPVEVFVGSWLALAAIAGIAVLAGRTLLRYVPVRLVRGVAAALFTTLAVLTGLEAAGIIGSV
jgi:putative Ca2+/H+ antiporter (TMEM165/GDT1 family)